MKRIKHLFTALLLLFSVAVNAHDFEVGGIYYYISNSTNKTVEVTYKGDYYNSYSNEYTGNVVIPESVAYNGNTYSVTSIGNSAFYECSGLTSIVIGNSVTSIGGSAFSYCSGLTSIEIPNSVTSIGISAFYGCSGLTSIVIGNSVTSIGGSAFAYCSGLTSIVVAGGNAKYDSRENCNAIIEKETNTLISGCKNTKIPGSVTSIGSSAFYGCSGLTSITIPNSVTSIGTSAFSGCSGLTSITIPNSVTSIGNGAFRGCSGFNSIIVEEANTVYDSRNNCNAIIETATNALIWGCKNSIIPNDITSIGHSAFYKCFELTNITIPYSVTSIGNSAFYECSGLTSIVIGNSVTSIGGSAFSYCSGLTSIEIPNSVTSIGISAFYGCSGLTSIVIGNSVTSIGGSAFAYCSGLTSIVVAGGNAKYDSRENCNAIIEKETNTLISGCKNTKIPGSVTSIGSSAFYGCSGLTSITIPNSVTSIGTSAFSGCSGLTSIVIGNSVTSIGDYAFNGCSGLTSIVIPNSVTSIGSSAFSGCSGLTSIEIPNSVTSIGSYAFSGCSGLTSITIPNSVTSIGKGAFRGCSGVTSIVVAGGNAKYDSRENCNAIIETATNALVAGCKNTIIPNSVTSIGDAAFQFCYGLTSIVIPNSVTSIEDLAFYGCTGLTSVEIPNSVTSIGLFAFSGCSGLTNVTIGNSITSIGDEAFMGCSGLKTVINFSNLTFTKGSTDYGYVAYYADNIINGFIEGDFVFNIIDGVNTLVEYLGYDTQIVLPPNYKGGNYVIGDNVFKDNTTITSIAIPSSVTGFGNDVFYDCTGLNAVYIHDLTSWCNIDFANYSANPLVRAKNLCLNGETVTELVIPDNISEIKQYTFLNCSTLTKVTIPGSVTTLGNYAFSGCVELADVTIPNSVTSIGECAFQNCTPLAEIIIPNSITKIGDKAFFECKNLKSVINCSELIIEKGSVENGMVGFYADEIINLPNNFDSIVGDFVFAVIDGVNTLVSYIGNDSEITLPDNYKGETYVIGENAFEENTTITKVTIPNSVTSIGDNAFYGCTGLTAVYIDNLAAWCNMEFATPESNPLYYAKNLYLHGEVVTELVVPGNVSVVKQYAFYNCSEITNIVISNSVTSIGDSAFRGCSNVKGLYLGNSVESFGDNAFAGCNSLLEIRNSSIIAIECNENIFSNNTYNNAKLYVPEGREEFYEKVTPWNKFIMNELNSTDYLFTITYMVNDNAYYTYALKQGEAVPSPLVTIEGYTFNSWEELPEVMPAEDIFVYGTLSTKCYMVTFMVDGKEYKTISLEYGKEITLPEAPEKEGYTFVGWNEVPKTMPDEDITIEAIFTINSYLVTFFVDGEKYHEESVEYGARIPFVPTPFKAGYVFSGWRNLPQTMPARDVYIYGSFNIIETGIDEVKEELNKVEIYNLKGERIINTENLPKGIYIIDGKKVFIK